MEYIIIDNNNIDLCRDGFIKLYQESFSEPPYNETWSYETVLDTWNVHLNNGLIVVCLFNDIVIGFVCGYQAKLKVTKDIDQMTNKLESTNKLLDFDLDKTIYVSELAVMKEHRGRGIAKTLVAILFNEFKKNGMIHYFMRSDLNNSQSAPLFIRYFNGKQMDITVENSSAEILANSASAEKGFWYGPL